jgi:hypothetical protein
MTVPSVPGLDNSPDDDGPSEPMNSANDGPKGRVMTGRMVRVKYLVCAVGSYYVRNVGDECDVDAAEVGPLVAAGQVERVKVEKKPAK